MFGIATAIFPRNCHHHYYIKSRCYVNKNPFSFVFLYYLLFIFHFRRIIKNEIKKKQSTCMDIQKPRSCRCRHLKTYSKRQKDALTFKRSLSNTTIQYITLTREFTFFNLDLSRRRGHLSQVIQHFNQITDLISYGSNMRSDVLFVVRNQELAIPRSNVT